MTAETVAPRATPPGADTFGISPTWVPPPRRRRWFRRAFLTTLALTMLGVGVMTGLLANEVNAYAERFDGRMLPGTVVAGIDVAEMTPEQATEAVAAVINEDLDRSLVLEWADHEWTTTPRELGWSADTDEVIARASAATENLGWEDWARLRFVGASGISSHDVTIADDTTEADGLITEIAEAIDRPVRDAAIEVESGWVELTTHRNGYEVDRDATTDALIAALDDPEATAVDVVVDRQAPEVTDDAFAQVLLVRQGERKLYLYEDGEVARSWTVAIGSGGHPTPTGTFEIEAKRHMPTWVNPAPNGWGADMPAQIGPGPNNPLGLRALNWSGGGAIRFHGTNNLASLGTAASKGCVRLSNSDVVDLYDRVETGATIVSLW